MKRSTLVIQLILVAAVLAGVPAGLFYYYDNVRAVQFGVMQSKILSVENQKDISIIRENISAKLDNLGSRLAAYTPDGVTRRYSSITGNRIIRNFSYTQAKSKNRIASEFSKTADKMSSDAALLYINGNVLDSNKPFLKSKSFIRNSSFLLAKSSNKIISDINFSEGTAEYFIPITDIKSRLVSVLYVKENISVLSDAVRSSKQSERGYNFIVDTAGRMLLNSDRQKENSENIMLNPEIKAVLSDSEKDSEIRETSYNNLKGLLGYRRLKGTSLTLCVFSPYADYDFMQRPAGAYESSLADTSFFIPVYAIIGGVFLICLFIIGGITAAPFKPLKKITRALRHVDDESFEAMLPKIKKGSYKKVIDALLILKGRVKAAEDKTQKLSQMLKEREEELSAESSRADAEISELRDAVKIAENSKAEAEEKLLKEKQDKEDKVKEIRTGLETEKASLNQKIILLEKEINGLKQEVKKAGESKVPAEKENMRTESVLMMNTELKGVLSVIKTYISSVLGGEGKITDAQQQFLGVVINKSARLERLINDLTELARLEKGEIKINKAKVDVNTVVQDIIFAIQPQADIKKVEMKINFAPTIPAGIGDSARLSNIVSQILNQAIKVSPRGGQVKVETLDREKEAVIRITDFGMSMPQSKTNALFVNFHGPESPAGPEFVNTGLRFPIIKAVINNMGGEIYIESEIGKGKSFVITLPKKEGEKTSVPGPAAAKQPGGQGFSGFKPAEAKAPSKPETQAPAKKPSAPPPPSSAPGGPKIQRNLMTDIAMSSTQVPGTQKKEEKKEAPGPGKGQDVPTVSDLLSFDDKTGPAGPKKDLPGKDVEVPAGLMDKKTPPLPSPPKEQKASGGSIKVDGAPGESGRQQGPDKKQEQVLPDELPPLPDLEDDKGTDII